MNPQVTFTTQVVTAGSNKPHLIVSPTNFKLESVQVQYTGGVGTAPTVHVMTPTNPGEKLIAVNKNTLPGAEKTALYESGEGCHATIEIAVPNNCFVACNPQGEFGPDGIRANHD